MQCQQTTYNLTSVFMFYDDEGDAEDPMNEGQVAAPMRFEWGLV